MTAKERERLARLKRRIAHVELRIASHPDKDLAYDKAEVSALQWAVDFIEGALGAESDSAKEQVNASL